MGIDETIWVDIHGPKDEIDEIEMILRYINDFRYLIDFYNTRTPQVIEMYEKNPGSDVLGLKTEGGKLFTLYKNGHRTGNIETLLKFQHLDFSPLNDRDDFNYKDEKLTNICRKNETHLHAYRSFTYRSSYPNIKENIQELSKHFPNTLFRYHCESEDNYIWLFICKHTNGKHVVWSTGWQEIQKRRWWTSDEIRERNAERKNTTTTIECGCKPLLMVPCQYTSPIYKCYLEVYGIDKEVVDIFEKCSVKVKQYNKKELFMRFKYTGNPIILMEWLSEKYKGCYFVCNYTNANGIECRWEEYTAIHYPYTRV